MERALVCIGTQVDFSLKWTIINIFYKTLMVITKLQTYKRYTKIYKKSLKYTTTENYQNHKGREQEKYKDTEELQQP